MLEYSFIIALMVLFVHHVFTKGNIFEKIGIFVKKKLGEYWCKPLTCCAICSTPWYGAIIYFVGSRLKIFEILPIQNVIFILFAATGINVVLTYIIEADKAEIKDLKEK